MHSIVLVIACCCVLLRVVACWVFMRWEIGFGQSIVGSIWGNTDIKRSINYYPLAKVIFFSPHFPPSLLLLCCDSDALDVWSENTVFQTVVNWWIDNEKGQCRDQFERLFAHVRLPYCTSSYLVNYVRPQLSKYDLLSIPAVHNALLLAERFHLMPDQRHEPVDWKHGDWKHPYPVARQWRITPAGKSDLNLNHISGTISAYLGDFSVQAPLLSSNDAGEEKKGEDGTTNVKDGEKKKGKVWKKSVYVDGYLFEIIFFKQKENEDQTPVTESSAGITIHIKMRTFDTLNKRIGCVSMYCVVGTIAFPVSRGAATQMRLSSDYGIDTWKSNTKIVIYRLHGRSLNQWYALNEHRILQDNSEISPTCAIDVFAIMIPTERPLAALVPLL